MGIIEVKNLRKLYGVNIGIDDVSFSMPKGQIFGFIGPNGAGKSTTIRIIMGLLYPTAGQVLVNGLDPIKDFERIKEFTGYVPSESVFYKNINVMDLLKYSADLRGCSMERARNLIDILELDTKKKGKELSLGNAKKVAIILALMHEPELLILDEPTSGLDPVIQYRFFEIIREENKKGASVLLSTHHLNDVEAVCENAAIIKKGRILDVLNIPTIVQQHGSIQDTFIRYYNEGFMYRAEANNESTR